MTIEKCLTCKHAFTTGKDRLYCKKSLADKDDCGEYEVLPPVIPQLKTGHWSHDGSHWRYRFICSECGYKLFDEQTNFCPNCGVKMEEDK